MKKSLYIALTAALLQTTSLYGAAMGGAGDVDLLTDPRGTNPRAFVYNPQDATGAKDPRVEAIKEAQFEFQKAITALKQIGDRFTGYFDEVAGDCGGVFEAEPIDTHIASEITAIRGRLSASFEAIADRALKDSLMGKILPFFDAMAARYGSIWNPLLPEARAIEDFLRRHTALNDDGIYLKSVYVDGGEEASSVSIHGRTGVSLDVVCDMLNRAGAVRREYETALALHPFFAFPMQPLILWLSDTDHFYHYDTNRRKFTRREFPLSWRGLFDSYARGAGLEESLRAEAAVIADIATDKELRAPIRVTTETLAAPSYGAGRMVLHSKTDIINAANRRAGLDLLAHDAGVGAAGAGAPRVDDGRDALADAEAKRAKIAASGFTAGEFEELVALGVEIEGIAGSTHDATESVMRYGRLAKDRLASGLSHGEFTKRLLANQLRKRHTPLVESSLAVLKSWFSTLLTDLNKPGEIGEIHRALDYTNTKANTPDVGDAESQPFNRQFIEALWELRSFYEGHRAMLGSNKGLREDFNVLLDFLLDTIKAHYNHCPQGAIGRALWTRYILCQFIADHGAMLNGARASLPAAAAAGWGGAWAPLAAPAGGAGARAGAAPLGDVWGGPRAFATAAAAPAAAGWGGVAWPTLAAPAGGAGAALPRLLGSRTLTVQDILSQPQYNESIRDAKVLFSDSLADLIGANSFGEALGVAALPDALLDALREVGLDTDKKIVDAIQTYNPATVAAAAAATAMPTFTHGGGWAAVPALGADVHVGWAPMAHGGADVGHDAAAARRDAEALIAVEARRIAEREVVERAAAEFRAAERTAAEDAARRAEELEAARIAAEARAAEVARAVAAAAPVVAPVAAGAGGGDAAEARGALTFADLPPAYAAEAPAFRVLAATKGWTEDYLANRINSHIKAYPTTTPASLKKTMRIW